MLVFACPGQGSQTEGFLKPWLESSKEFGQHLRRLSEAAGLDLVRLGTIADEAEIKATENAQPLIVGATIATYRTFFEGRAEGALGHSVGEFAAAAIAGVISDEDAMKLVSIRGKAMAKASAAAETTMAAILGGDSAEVEKAVADAGLYAANFNGASQLVAAGSREAMTGLIANPPERTRVIELKVAGAFHTPFMVDAVAELNAATESISIQDPAIAIWTNFDGRLIKSGKEFVSEMVQQTARPVRWDMCMARLSEQGATVVELPPAGALAGLIKRGAQGVSALALKTEQDIAKVEEL